MSRQEKEQAMATGRDRGPFDGDVFDETEEDTLESKYLTFKLGDEEYGIAIRRITEIIAIQRITEVPDVPDFVKGVINLRGHVIPVVDVRRRFRLPELAYGERTCVVIVSIDETPVGLVVDAVQDVLDIPQESISAPPKVLPGTSGRYMQGMARVGDGVKILLDVERLLFEHEKEKLESMNQGGSKEV